MDLTPCTHNTHVTHYASICIGEAPLDACMNTSCVLDVQWVQIPLILGSVGTSGTPDPGKTPHVLGHPGFGDTSESPKLGHRMTPFWTPFWGLWRGPDTSCNHDASMYPSNGLSPIRMDALCVPCCIWCLDPLGTSQKWVQNGSF